MRRGLRRDGVLAGLLVALLGVQLGVTTAPASAAVCGNAVGTGYTVTVCLDAPGQGAVLSGSTEVTRSYQLNWKTPKTYAGSCRTLRMDLGDGVQHTAEFRFTG